MTEHKFTDEEVIKALEICAINTVSREGYFTYQGIPLRYLCEDALDLINRQRAEIERLEKHNTEYARKHYQDGRAEAIKEFADRLCEGRVSNDPVVIAVNAELKMTEEKE